MYTVKKYLMEIEVKGAMRSRVQSRLICVRLNTGVLRSAIAWVASAATNHWLALRCYSLIVEDIVTDGVSPERDLIAVSLDARFLVSIWPLPGVQLVRRTQKTACEKIKKSTARRRERMPVGKLYKRSFHPLIDRLQRPITLPPACGFQLSTLLWNMLTEYFKLRLSNWKPTFRDVFCNRNEPKQSLNTAWQITEVSNSAKQKVNIPKTERLMYGCHERYLQIFTHKFFSAS